MRELCLDNHINKVAMPRIACGLDKCNFDDVRKIIKEVFEDTDVEILVCYL
jgi:O-acetyl-ADP-ribose deacetylase (regulator of RNase III)